MISKDKRYILLSISFAVLLCSGCGSTGSTEKKDEVKKETPADDSVNTPTFNKVDDNKTDEKKDTHSIGFTVEEGVLYDIRQDGTKLVWVNSTSDACYVYNSNEKDEDIKVFGKNYCENLTHQGITTWQLPTEKDAQYLMSHVDDGSIIYPNSHKGCQFMITENSSDYKNMVGTTNSGREGEVIQDQNQAGIRCVSVLK
jgi:hypothetical protein